MTDHSSSNSSSSLEEILAELEKKFSAPLETDDEKPTSRRSGTNDLSKASKTRILTGLTLLLVISGSVAGFYLTQTDQELRQQAQEAEPTNIQVVDTDLDLSFLISFANPQVQSTVLTFTGPTNTTITLNAPPFSINASALGLVPGSYSVEAVGYNQPNGLGVVLERHTANFIVPSR
jgi:hypothetical protein